MKKKFMLYLPIFSVLLGASNLGQESLFSKQNQQNRMLELPSGAKVKFREFMSVALGGKAQYAIFLPSEYNQKLSRSFPVIYFLHGMHNDHTSWTEKRYGNLPLVIEKLILTHKIPPFLMVHPNGNNSFYTNTLNGNKKYENYIYKDLIREIENNFRARISRSSRALAGTSMGGYGALKIAMKYPELYSSVASASPIIFLGNDPSHEIANLNPRHAKFLTSVFHPIFGIPFNLEHWKKNSIELLAQTQDLKDLNIYIAYGTADRYLSHFPMEKGINKVNNILNQRNISHTFRIYHGEPHGWELIRRNIGEILEFLTATF